MAGEVDQERHSSVQEMVNHGVHELPNKYICKDPVYDGSKNPTSLPSIEIPVINHGIEVGILGEMEEISREFFHLPKEEKQKYTRQADDLEGYGTDRLYLIVNPEDGRKLQFLPQNPIDFSFLNQYGEKPLIFCRFNFYPACPRPEQVLGLKPHTDASVLTILLQDKEVEGLQLVKDNQWYKFLLSCLTLFSLMQVIS
ncbi:hypothetical protein M9H77_35299 [Catharanthus roseus]|uniref:Uncharacterized protein n=1 Tax=Catharanthus roseus TaxID=4058 RepID=A0ACB9ZNM3_CATRO|nr:hypothetical protein M9H77_35299 [Catharanthus roseus]